MTEVGWFLITCFGLALVYGAITRDREIPYDARTLLLITLGYAGAFIFAFASEEWREIDTDSKKDFPAPICYEEFGVWELDKHDAIIRMISEEFEEFCLDEREEQ